MWPEDAWYRTFADWAVSTGAFTAPDGEFNPGGVVARADMAVMMIASFPHLDAVEEAEGPFNDATGADPAVILDMEGNVPFGGNQRLRHRAPRLPPRQTGNPGARWLHSSSAPST